MIRYLSVCSGIEAASVAWEPLGFKPIAFAETADFPSAVLHHRWPHVDNLGDFTRITQESLIGPIDLIVGGTPCQSFSLNGKRRGLDDCRGNLTLEFISLVKRLRPRWLVWENVSGVLSLERGRIFGTVLWRLAELGYGFAYRVLDAKFFGVPQQRKRLFLVGYLGATRPAIEVLFGRESEGGPAGQSHRPQEAASGMGDAGFEVGMIKMRSRDGIHLHERIIPTLVSGNGGSNRPRIIQNGRLRRMTPRECERTQGFPDDHTLIPGYGNVGGERRKQNFDYLIKSGYVDYDAEILSRCPDGPRYEAVGNSMAVPVMREIGERILETTSRIRK